MVDVCRLCLNEVSQVYHKMFNEPEEFSLQIDKIKFLMPEIDIYIIPKFVVCNECLQSLNTAYTFKYACIEVEDFIKEYTIHKKPLTVDLEHIRNIRNQKLYSFDETFSNEEEIANDINDLNGDAEDFVEIENIKNEINLVFICDKCNEHFYDEGTFQEHKQKCVSYSCGQCSEILLNKEQLGKHLESHATAHLTCGICNRTYKRAYELKRHANRHHFVCDICNKGFLNENELKQHIISHSNQELEYECDVCKERLHNLTTLIRHKQKHTGDEYNCTTCAKSYNNAEGLRRHMKNVHFGKYVCDTCGTKCGTTTALVQHKRTHTGERPYKCEICGKGFAQPGTLGTHIRCTHINNRPHVCELCGKAFTLKCYLKLHQLVHMENLEKQYPCPDCEKTFKRRKDLTRHRHRHTGIKNHKCTVCSKDFIDPASLRKHMRSHTGERPYECHTCQKRFSLKYNLQIHFRSHKPKVKSSK